MNSENRNSGVGLAAFLVVWALFIAILFSGPSTNSDDITAEPATATTAETSEPSCTSTANDTGEANRAPNAGTTDETDPTPTKTTPTESASPKDYQSYPAFGPVDENLDPLPLSVGIDTIWPTFVDIPSFSTLESLPFVPDVFARIQAAQQARAEEAEKASLPLVTDFSYFRLARQGKAQLIPGLDDFSPASYNKDSLPEEINLANLDTTGPYHYSFTEAQTGASPGTIISQITGSTFQSIISVPELPEALQAFIDARGENVLMSYTAYTSGDIECRMEVCCSEMGVIIYPDTDRLAVGLIPGGYNNCLAYHLAHDIYLTEATPNEFLMADDAAACCYYGRQISYHNYGNNYQSLYCCMAYYRNNNIVDGVFESNTEELGISTITETSFTPTEAQIERIMERMQEYEASPLQEELLPVSQD